MIKSILWKIFSIELAVGLAGLMGVSAIAVEPKIEVLDQLNRYSQQGRDRKTKEQVTSVHYSNSNEFYSRSKIIRIS